MAKTRDDKVLKEFGLRLQQIREKKGISLRKLEAISDIDFSQIHRIEKGLTNPSLTTILALAKALEVEVSELMKNLS